MYHRINDYLVSNGAIPEDVEIPDYVNDEVFERILHLYEMFLDFKENVLDKN
jgi:hypothetical protein